MLAPMRALRLLLVLLLLLPAAGCADTEPGADATPVDPVPTEVPGAGATEGGAGDEGAAADPVTTDVALVGPDGQAVAFTVELAADPPSRQLGLMHRTELAPDAGMLFLFPADGQGGFWMKNTRIPLQIAYVAADGEVVDVLDMDPCEADPCPSYVPRAPYRYALEVNAGALDEAGVEPGWRLELPGDLPTAT
jgi:uncharacterized protein